jgi:hypothetical protein
MKRNEDGTLEWVVDGIGYGGEDVTFSLSEEGISWEGGDENDAWGVFCTEKGRALLAEAIQLLDGMECRICGKFPDSDYGVCESHLIN